MVKIAIVAVLLASAVGATIISNNLMLLASDQGSITAGERAYGSLDADNEDDVWWFSGTIGERIQVRVDEDLPRGLSPFVALLGVDGETSVAEADVVTRSFVHLSATLPETGRYYLVVSSFQSTAGGYTLEWNRVIGEPFNSGPP